METLGEKIKTLRETMNITQPELAKITEVSNGMISLWENNKHEPKASHIKKLAIVFKVSADYLLGLENEDGSKYEYEFEYQHTKTTLKHKETKK